MDKSKMTFFRQSILGIVLLMVVFIWLSGCTAKPQDRVYKVGIISGAQPFANIADGFKEKMTELGYLEGKNIVYDFQSLNADPAGEQRVAKQFVEDKVDLILSFPTEPAVAAKAAAKGTGIPVVFALAGLEGVDLVDSVREPGGDITGVRFPGPESTANRLEILHEMMPQVKSVLIIYDKNYPNAPSALEQLHIIAPSLGIVLVEKPITNLQELESVLDEQSQLDHIEGDAIFILPEILMQSGGWPLITAFAQENHVPIIGALRNTAGTGALFAFSSDHLDLGRRAAILADQIFHGIPAGTIPVVTPESSLWIDYKVAQELGINLSEGLLSRADKIIR